VVESHDYYPFGLDMPSRSYISPQITERNKELFTGKERDSETGWDYFGARYYDPAIGRWLSVDPLAQKAPDMTPYHYTHNSPINRFDPDGKDDFNYFLMPGETDFDFDNRWNRLSNGDRKLELYHFTGEGPQVLDPMATSLALGATISSAGGFIPNPISAKLAVASVVVQGFSTFLKFKHFELQASYGIPISREGKRDAQGDIIGVAIGRIEPTAGVISDLLYENLDNEDKANEGVKIHRQEVINESITTSLLKSVAADIGLIPRTCH
jgi:RHS repeat-associated protein